MRARPGTKAQEPVPECKVNERADPTIAKLLAEFPPLELLRVVPMPEAERLSSLSSDTLEREHGDKIVQISPRRKGMRVIHALLLRGT
jgi:hypothetical protein